MNKSVSVVDKPCGETAVAFSGAHDAAPAPAPVAFIQRQQQMPVDPLQAIKNMQAMQQQLQQ